MRLRLFSTALILFFGASALAHAQNQEIGFSRTPLAIGTVTNKMLMQGDARGLEKGQPAGSQSLVIAVSKQLAPDQSKEIHSYLTSFLPGGHSNWHSHPGLEIDQNPAAGNPVAFYFVNRDGTCRKDILSPGQSHLIMPGEVHMAINESSAQTVDILVLRVHTGDSREFLPVGSAIPNPNFVPVTVGEAQPHGDGCLVL